MCLYVAFICRSTAYLTAEGVQRQDSHRSLSAQVCVYVCVQKALCSKDAIKQGVKKMLCVIGLLLCADLLLL